MADQGWLVCDQKVLTSVEIATCRSERRRGLRGRDHVDGAYVLNAKSVHTIGMKFPIDVAFCNAEGEVLKIYSLKPWRITPVHTSAAFAIETEAVAFEKWGIHEGDYLEIR